MAVANIVTAPSKGAAGKSKGGARGAKFGCGSGHGGFKPGNTCGKGGRKGLADRIKAARSKAKAGLIHHGELRKAVKQLRDNRRGNAGAISNDQAKASHDLLKAHHKEVAAAQAGKNPELKAKLTEGATAHAAAAKSGPAAKAKAAAEKADKALADAHHARQAAKAAKASQEIKDADKTQKAADAAHAASHGGSPGTENLTGKASPAGPKPAPANEAAPKSTPTKPATTPAKTAPPTPAAHTAPEKSRAAFNAKKSALSLQDAEAQASKIIGKDTKWNDITSIIGSPHDSNVYISKSSSSSLEITTEGKGYFSVRVLHRDKHGKPYIENHFSEVTSQGKGTGTRVFGDQVAHATAHGIDRIEMIAARSFKADGSDSLIGYKVWPKFGFDAPIHPETRARLPKPLRKAKNVSDLMQTEAGRSFWAERGGGIEAKFDLNPGSASHKIWDDYRAAKAAKGGG